MQCFILAGGFATRLWPLTERRAKPLLPVAGRPLLTHLVEKVPDGMDITVSTNAAFGEDMRAWAKTLHRTVRIIVEDASHDDCKLGALGALSAWIQSADVHDDVLLLTGDNYLGFSLNEFLSCFTGNPLIAAYDIGDLEQAKRFGTVIVSGKDVVAFEEKPTHSRSTIVSTGCSILPARSREVICEYAAEHPDNIGGIFEEFLRREQKVDAFVFSEPWIDIGSFDAYMAVHRLTVKGELLLDRASVDRESIIEGSVALGSGTRIIKSTLIDCIIVGTTTIEDCVLRECVIDEGCVLRGVDLSRKMLRSNTVLRR